MNHDFLRFIVKGGMIGVLILFEYVVILKIYWGRDTDFLLIIGLIDLVSGGIVGVIGSMSIWFMCCKSSNRNAESLVLLVICIIAVMVFYCCGWMRENLGYEWPWGIIPYLILGAYFFAVVMIYWANQRNHESRISRRWF